MLITSVNIEIGRALTEYAVTFAEKTDPLRQEKLAGVDIETEGTPIRQKASPSFLLSPVTVCQRGMDVVWH